MLIRVLLGLNGLFIASQWRSLSNVTPSHRSRPEFKTTRYHNARYTSLTLSCSRLNVYEETGVSWHMAMAHTTAEILKEKGNRVAWNMHEVKSSHAQLSRRPTNRVQRLILATRMLYAYSDYKLISMWSSQMKTCRDRKQNGNVNSKWLRRKIWRIQVLVPHQRIKGE